MRKSKNWQWWKWITFGIGLIVINILASKLGLRWDMTSSGLYTLSERNREIIKNNDDRIVATLFMGDNIPSSFKKLKSETEFFLSTLHKVNDKIWYDVFDPNQGTLNQVNALRNLFAEKNINPTNIRISTSDGVNETLIYPYIHLEKGGAELFINILEDRKSGESEEDAVYRSVQKLESKVAKGIYELSKPMIPRIGLIAFDKFLKKTSFDLNNYLKQKYRSSILSPSDLYFKRDSTSIAIIPISPEIIVSKEDLTYIDQFLLNGGKIIWLVEEYNMALDSINSNGSFVPPLLDFGVNDFLFQNGIKLTGSWISDLRSSRIPQVIGEQGGRAQTEMFNFPFHLVMHGNSDHFISSGLGEINMLFPTKLDTTFTSSAIEKIPLTSSSEYSKSIKYPFVFSFESLRQSPVVESYNEKGLMTSILLEGKFNSYFKNRMSLEQEEVLRRKGLNFLKESIVPSAQIVISDQNIFMPGVDRSGRPFPIGFNKWERSIFTDNETFLNNSIEYLINGDEFLRPDERSDQRLAALDKQKVLREGNFWIGFNLIFPLILLLITYLGFSFYLKKKYA